MKLKLFVIPILTLFAGLIGAQPADYYIRVDIATNLRVSYSLDSAVHELVPEGTILHVLYEGTQGNWLQVERNGMKVWMARWLSHSRVAAPGAQPAAPAASAPVVPVPSAPTNVDNCCFVNMQCTTDAEWRAGWHAYRDNQCVALPSQVSAPSSSGSLGVYDFSGAGQTTSQTVALSSGVWKTTVYTSESASVKAFKLSGERCLYTYRDDTNESRYLIVKYSARSGGGNQSSDVITIYGSCTVALNIDIRGSWRVRLEKVPAPNGGAAQNIYQFTGNGQTTSQAVTLSSGVWKTTVYTSESASVKAFKLSGQRCLYTFRDDTNDSRYLIVKYSARSGGGNESSDVTTIHGSCTVTLSIDIQNSWRVTLEKL